MAQQFPFAGFDALEHRELWCKPRGDLWDGVDFDQCGRKMIFDGIISILFLALSLFFLTIRLLQLLATSLSRRRTSSAYQPIPSSTKPDKTPSSSPIAIAERDVILEVVQRQSPDWGNPATRQELLGETKDHADDENVEVGDLQKGKVTVKVALRALWGCKKDMLNVLGSAGMLALCVAKLVEALRRQEDGAGWLVLEVAAWGYAFLLTLSKLSISFSHRLFILTHPTCVHRNLPSFYTTLERHLIPFFTIYSTLTAFFDLRSALLAVYDRPQGSHVPKAFKTTLGLEAAIFGVSTFIFLLEILAPRPSRYSSCSASTSSYAPLDPPPELNASLFSIATFSFMEGFQWRTTFPSLTGAPILSLATVPDLRPDDKTARAILSYRRSMNQLDALVRSLPSPIRRAFNLHHGAEDLGLTPRLLYHFLPELGSQQVYAAVRVALNGAPPLFLQGILSHLSKRQRGEEAPAHVAVMFAWFLFLTTVVGSLGSSQALFIGRRVCIRLRSIIVGEVFCKALRRKDQAGSSASSAPSTLSTDPSDDADTAVASASATTDPSPAPAVEVSPDDTKDEQKELDEVEAALDKASTGKIINLISVDTYRLSEIAAYLHFLTMEMPFSIVVIVYLLFRLLGWSAIAGVTVLILITPIQAQIAKLYNKYQEALLAAADRRLTLATEVIGQVRIVKYFAWERKFLEKMDQTRHKELRALWRRALTMVVGGNLMFGAPIIVGVATFTFHTKVMKQDLTAETAFTAMALFNVLRNPLEGFTDMFVNVLQAHVSLKRIDKFLGEEETHKYSILHEAAAENDPVVGFVNGVFTWADEEKAREDQTVFRVGKLDLRFPEEGLSIICGPVGSGKTTLLMSLLGETNCLSGSAFLPSPVIRSASADPAILTDTTAFAAQQPWLLSATIRENILFGSKMNERRYKAVLEACALNPDLKQFELEDETEVGEKGTVLSGGQKARISLARAIYSPAKFVLLDDALSAVDSHTAQHLVEKCLTGRLMRHRTCILVTHAVDLCLPYASFVVSLDHGAVVSSGAPASLTPSTIRKLGELDVEEPAKAAESAITIEAIAEGETDEQVANEREEERRKRLEKLKLVKEETQSQGAVKGEVYLMYIRALGGWSMLAIIVGIYASAQLAEIAVNLALRYWAQSYDDHEASLHSLFAATIHTSASRYRSLPGHFAAVIRAPFVSATKFNTTGIFDQGQHPDPDYWLKLYCMLAVVSLALYSARVAFFLWRGLQASKVIYRQLIAKILGARIRFFDSTPTGRILNRLSKDIETIDQDVSTTGSFFFTEIGSVVGIIGTISVALPAFLPAAIVITALYAFLGKMYLASSRELKRYESVTRSPIFSLFGEALQGIATIRAYGDTSRFMQDIFRLLDQNNRPFFSLWLANRWLSVRVDTAGALVALLAALFIIFAPQMDPALAGFVMSFALAFNDRIIWVVRMWSTMEVNANSIERVQEYMAVEQESTGGRTPPAIWPSRYGSIHVKNLTASYAPDLPPVLKDVSFSVKGGEKIGIVGRTGSGKSTLCLSFFRFIEPTSGCIEIDGIDINTLRLDALRSALTIVAQEAALFAGTLRFNLDPFDQYPDSAVWDALRRVQMAAPGFSGLTPKPTPGPSRAASEDGTITPEETERYVIKSLGMQVKEGGKNFSAGQRQLLALARGILKLKHSASHILLLDESTASLDHATDECIQRTIRAEMTDSTILCIAHRLRTVIDYDKILVLDHGEVLEFETPARLLEDEGSAFSALCRKSGEYEALREMAVKAEKAKKERGAQERV
ncbi:hypothetical protein JCM1841_004577 [Sporobolomyces salmonicolor]